jgi:hypothetical protein
MNCEQWTAEVFHFSRPFYKIIFRFIWNQLKGLEKLMPETRFTNNCLFLIKFMVIQFANLTQYQK